MVKSVAVKDLREGDWLVDDVKVVVKEAPDLKSGETREKVLKADWDGLSKKDLELLAKVRKKIKIKEGIPFVPAFLIAFILWWFRDYLIGLVI